MVTSLVDPSKLRAVFWADAETSNRSKEHVREVNFLLISCSFKVVLIVRFQRKWKESEGNFQGRVDFDRIRVILYR